MKQCKWSSSHCSTITYQQDYLFVRVCPLSSEQESFQHRTPRLYHPHSFRLELRLTAWLCGSGRMQQRQEHTGSGWKARCWEPVKQQESVSGGKDVGACHKNWVAWPTGDSSSFSLVGVWGRQAKDWWGWMMWRKRACSLVQSCIVLLRLEWLRVTWAELTGWAFNYCCLLFFAISPFFSLCNIIAYLDISSNHEPNHRLTNPIPNKLTKVVLLGNLTFKMSFPHQGPGPMQECSQLNTWIGHCKISLWTLEVVIHFFLHRFPWWNVIFI